MAEKFDVLNELGEFTGQVASREDCHKKGLWHRAVYAFIIDKNSNVLLQKRSKEKKLWPNLWDVTLGGHVDSGEFGRQALIREAKEELGLDLNDNDIKYLVGSTSINIKGNIINKHYNECYLIKKDIDVSKIKLQKEEVSEVKYFSKEDILKSLEYIYENEDVELEEYDKEKIVNEAEKIVYENLYNKLNKFKEDKYILKNEIDSLFKDLEEKYKIS